MKIETERLILRKFTLDDLEAFASLMADPEVMRFSMNGPMKEVEQVLEYLQKRILDHYISYGYGLYAVIHKQDDCLIGYVGLINQCIDGEDKTELGYRLNPSYWGQGLATEASTAVCDYAFDTLNKNELISIIDPKNIPSLKVAERLGMKYWKDTIFHVTPVQIYYLQNPSKEKSRVRN
jgi:[ribosomal protein S5]-alanine N-acetyltransferase